MPVADVVRAMLVGTATMALVFVVMVWLSAILAYVSYFKSLRNSLLDEIVFYVFVLSIRIIVLIAIIVGWGSLVFYGLYMVGSKVLGYN